MRKSLFSARRRWHHLWTEALETRELLHSSIILHHPSGTTAEFVDDFSIPLMNLEQGDVVQVSARVNSEGPGFGSLLIDLGSKRIMNLTASVSGPEAIDEVFASFDGGAPNLNVNKVIGPSSGDELYGHISYRIIPGVTDLVPVSLKVNPTTGNLDFMIDVKSKRLSQLVAIKYEWISDDNTSLGQIVLPQGHSASSLGPAEISSGHVRSVESKYFAGAPVGATGIRATVDSDKVVAEKSDDNSVSLRLANVVALPAQFSDNGVLPGYRVDGGPFINSLGVAPITVRAYWSRIAKWTDKSSDRLLIGEPKPMNPNSTGDVYVEVGGDLTKQPSWARYILTRVDNLNYIPETNEGDNNVVRALFSVEVSSLTWDNEGGADVALKIENLEAIPPKSNLRIEFVYSANESVDDALPGTSYTFLITRGGRGENLKNGINKWTIPPSEIVPPSAEKIRRFGHTATHLIAVVRQDGSPAVTNTKGQTKAIKLPVLSLELSNAPGASTALQRVRLWGEKYKSEIVTEAKRRGINPTAILAAIGWEAINNKHLIEDTAFGIPTLYYDWLRRVAGPGKVHAVYGSIVNQVWSHDPVPLVAQEVELLGYLPIKSEQERGQTARTAVGAIRYVAAILGAWADGYEGLGWNIRNDVGVLTTLYHGSAYPNLTALFNDASSKASWVPGAHPPQVPIGPPSEYMGRFALKYEYTFRKSLNSSYRPHKELTPFVPVTFEATIPYYNVARVQLLTVNGALVNAILPPKTGAAELVNGELLFTHEVGFQGTETINFTVRIGNRRYYGGRVLITVAPPAPTSVYATALNDSEVAISWATAVEPAHFRILQSTNGRDWATSSLISGTQASTTLNNLNPDTEYGFKVIAVSNDGRESGASDEVRARTLSLKPDGPTITRIENVNTSKFDVSWTSNGMRVSRFEAQVLVHGQWQLSENIPPEFRKATIEYEQKGGPTLRADHDYSIRLRAIGPDGTPSDWSDPMTTHTLSLKPGTPAITGIDNVAAKKFDVSWTSSGKNVSGFQAQILADGQWQLSENILPEFRKATIEYEQKGGPTLRADHDYSVRLRAIGPDGTPSDWSEPVMTRTLSLTPDAPSGLNLVSKSSTSLSISWRDNSRGQSAETKFQVYLSLDGVHFYLSEDVPANGERAKIEYEKRGGRRLQANTKYWIEIYAFNEYGRTRMDGPVLEVRTNR